MRLVAAILGLAALTGGGFGPVGDMRVPRAAHTATALPDGRVLLAGGCIDHGCESATATTELFDPATQRFEPGPALRRQRVGHVAVPLRDGAVLVVGGWSGANLAVAAERLVDGAFVPAGRLGSPRGGLTATVLRDGRVLVVGGTDGSRTLATAELYEPRFGRFVSTGSMRAARSAHTATLLRDGRVLVVGGSADEDVLRSAELYDPRTGRFTPAGSLRSARHKHAAVRLRDGRVLVVGGSDARDFGGRYRSTELWSPKTKTFRAAPQLREPRFKLPNAVVRLSSGDVLVAGGGRTVERFRPGGRFVGVGTIDGPLAFATATLLPGSHVLVTGGYDESITPTAGAWFYGAP